MQKIPKDPIMCLSFVNTQLRDAYNSLEELCRAFDVKKEELEERLAAVGYVYQPELNQFRFFFAICHTALKSSSEIGRAHV